MRNEQAEKIILRDYCNLTHHNSSLVDKKKKNYVYSICIRNLKNHL